MYTYIYTFTYIHIYIYIHICIIYIYTCMHIYMYMYIFHMYQCTYLHLFIYSHIHIYICAYIIYSYIHIYMYTYIHRYMYTYIHSYIHLYLLERGGRKVGWGANTKSRNRLYSDTRISLWVCSGSCLQCLRTTHVTKHFEHWSTCSSQISMASQRVHLCRPHVTNQFATMTIFST